MYEKNEQASSYVDLASSVSGTWINAFAQTNQRMLGYGKSLFEIVTRPYTSTAMELTYRENFERAQQVVDLTVNELQSGAAQLSGLVEQLVAHGTKAQEMNMESARGLMRTWISNLNYVRETTDKQFEGITKRVEEMQTRSSVSAN